MTPLPKLPGKELSSVRRLYERALFERSAEAAEKAISTALGLGAHPLEIYDEIIIPTQKVVGERWHDGQISISEEHVATQMAIDQMNRLRGLIRAKPPLHKRAIVGSMTGDPHWLGARIVADHFYYDGWDVDFLGGAPPLADLREYIEKTSPDLVILSVTVATEFDSIRRLAVDLAKMKPPPQLVIGGRVFTDSTQSTAELKGVAIASDPREALTIGRKLCGVLHSDEAIEQVLALIGRKVQETRKALKMSQLEVADASGLDRAYISAIESGKQNISIGVLLRLAAALDVSAEELLRTDGFL